MTFVLDAGAILALLRNDVGAEVVQSVLLEDEGEAYTHISNVVEAFYILHREGALAAYLIAHPERLNATQPDKPDLTGLDFLDPAVFDEAAGNQRASIVLQELHNMGIGIMTTMDTAFWEDAARLKSRFRRVSLPDCYGVALARRLNASFVTSDRHELEALDAAGIADFTFIR